MCCQQSVVPACSSGRVGVCIASRMTPRDLSWWHERSEYPHPNPITKIGSCVLTPPACHLGTLILSNTFVPRPWSYRVQVSNAHARTPFPKSHVPHASDMTSPPAPFAPRNPRPPPPPEPHTAPCPPCNPPTRYSITPPSTLLPSARARFMAANTASASCRTLSRAASSPSPAGLSGPTTQSSRRRRVKMRRSSVVLVWDCVSTAGVERG